MKYSKKLHIIIFILINLLCYATSTSYCQPCEFREGEVYFLSSKTLNLRENPDISAKIIKVLNETYAVIVISPDSVRNNFIYVKAFADSFDDAKLEIVRYDVLFGWISFVHLNLKSDDFSFLRESDLKEDEIREIIDAEELKKRHNSCKYNPSYLAYMHNQLGIILFEQEKFFQAIEQFNKTIEIATVNSTSEKIISYYYRGKCKFELKDYSTPQN